VHDRPGDHLEVPTRTADIGRAWLDAVLGSPSDEVTVEDLGAGVGLLGEVARVRRHGGRPASVVVKLPPADPGNRGIVRRFGYDVREAGFYRELHPGTTFPAPVCLARAEGAQGPVLVLEDLAGHRRPDQLVGATEPEVLAVADLAAAVHARFWDDPSLPGRPWLPGPTDDAVAGYGTLFELCWAPAADAAAATPDERRAARLAMDRFHAVCRHFARSPHTLVHGDLRLDNVLFGAIGAAAVDWQLAAWGRGAYDLAFFAAGSVEPELRRRIERRFVERWHAGLVAAGIGGYPLGAAWSDYRLGLVLNLPNPVTAAVAVHPGNERGRALLDANLRRALVAVADHWLDPDPGLLAALEG
jgi:hypothetical protein